VNVVGVRRFGCLHTHVNLKAVKRGWGKTRVDYYG
jgi:hypothetical protein